MRKLLRAILDFIRQIRANKTVLIIGDSHVAVFLNKHLRRAFPNWYFKVSMVGGATASGLENPNSKTQAYKIFRNSILSTPADKTIMLLGEVDTGFVIWYRAEKYGASVEEMLGRAVDNYVRLIQEAKGNSEIICISTPLPTISDNQDWGEVANERKNIRASQKERTELTLLFNKKMREKCLSMGATFISLDRESQGEDGLVKRSLLNSDPSDHHYEQSRYAEILVSKLRIHLG